MGDFIKVLTGDDGAGLWSVFTSLLITFLPSHLFSRGLTGTATFYPIGKKLFGSQYTIEVK